MGRRVLSLSKTHDLAIVMVNALKRVAHCGYVNMLTETLNHKAKRKVKVSKLLQLHKMNDSVMYFVVLLPILVSNRCNIQLISCQGVCYENKYSHL